MSEGGGEGGRAACNGSFSMRRSRRTFPSVVLKTGFRFEVVLARAALRFFNINVFCRASESHEMLRSILKLWRLVSKTLRFQAFRFFLHKNRNSEVLQSKNRFVQDRHHSARAKIEPKFNTRTQVQDV